jgi:hypothetical protein
MAHAKRRTAPHQRRRSLHPSDERQARHPRDEAMTPELASRPESPEAGVAAQPAVDFDGLSWPSMLPSLSCSVAPPAPDPVSLRLTLGHGRHWH